MLQPLPLSTIFLTDISASSLTSLITKANDHLVKLRASVGRHGYARAVSIQLAGEAIVAFKMNGQLFDEAIFKTGAKPALPQAKEKVASTRDSLYKEYREVFEPYFDNEPGVVDLDLDLFRRASAAADRGDTRAMSQIEYMFVYYNAVLGMYYGYQALTLSGRSPVEAVRQVSGVETKNFIPASLPTLTAHFSSVLVSPDQGKVGAFEPLYEMPRH